MQTLTINLENTKQRRLPLLIGGLAQIPYVLIFFAYGIFITLTNLDQGAEAFIFYFAFFISGDILKFYKNQYSFEFPITTERKKGRAGFYKEFFITFGVFIAYLVFTILDYGMIFHIRLVPLITGIFMVLRGADWVHKNWQIFGRIHGGMGTVLIIFSFVPWFGGPDLQFPFFNLDLVLEYTLLGCAVAVIGLMEHSIVQNYFRSQNSGDTWNLENQHGKDSQTGSFILRGEERRAIPVLVGGFALLPYVLFFCLAGIFQEWLDQFIRDGSGYLLGLLLAYWIGYGIVGLNRKKLHFEFLMDTNRPSYSYKQSFLLLFSGILLMVLYLIDHSQVFPIRLIPLVTGLFMIFRGADWFRKNWRFFGLVHGVLGAVSIVFCFLPWYGRPVWPDQIIGFDLAIEYALLGCAVVVIGVMEHLIVRQVHDYRVLEEMRNAGFQVVGKTG